MLFCGRNPVVCYLAELAILGGKKTVQLPTYEWPVDFLKRYGQREADAVANVIRSGIVWGTFSPEISEVPYRTSRTDPLSVS